MEQVEADEEGEDEGEEDGPGVGGETGGETACRGCGHAMVSLGDCGASFGFEGNRVACNR